MTLLTNAVPLLWLIASAGAFFLVFKPRPRWPVVATPARALLVFVAVFLVGGALTAVTRPKDATPAPKPVQVAKPVNLPDPALVRAHPESYLKLGRVTIIRSKTGSVLATSAATNTTGLPLRDPQVSCRMLSGDVSAGTVSAVVRATVPPGGQVIFAAIDLGQAEGPWDRWECKITKAQVAG
jgi:hypothetical protein